MTTFAAALGAGLLFILASIHVFWAAGGRWGKAVALPSDGTKGQPIFNPGIFACLTVAALLYLACGMILARAGWLMVQVPSSWLQRATWFLAAIFLLRAMGDFRYVGFFKKIRHTAFAYWDTRLFSPLCMLIALLTARVALA